MQNNCPQCGGILREKSGVSKKTGKPYSFLGCSNYPNCDYIDREFKPAFNERVNESALLMDEMQAFRKEMNERLDSMEDWFAKNIVKTIEK